MNKLALIVICLLVSYDLKSQTQEQKIQSKDLKITEIFTVLKNDRTIRQGNYEKYIDSPHRALVEKGQFEKNKKVGIWNYYDEKGNIALQYNFDNDSILSYNGIQVDGLKKDRPLIYLGSRYEITHIAGWGSRISMEAHKLGQSGKVTVEIHISNKGEVTDYTIKQGINKVLDSEAIRVAKLIPKSWLPAIKSGEPVDYSFILPINFVILKRY